MQRLVQSLQIVWTTESDRNEFESAGRLKAIIDRLVSSTLFLIKRYCSSSGSSISKSSQAQNSATRWLAYVAEPVLTQSSQIGRRGHWPVYSPMNGLVLLEFRKFRKETFISFVNLMKRLLQSVLGYVTIRNVGEQKVKVGEMMDHDFNSNASRTYFGNFFRVAA